MRIFSVRLLILLLLFPLPAAAAVTAQVDKPTLYLGEKFTLTLETDQSGEHRPNLRPLQTDYALLATKRVTISSHRTGSISTRTRWLLLMRPLHEGVQTVPALSLGNEQTQALSLHVLPSEQNPSPASTGLRPLYLEVELDRDELYVKSQAILKARIFHLAPLPANASLSAPESKDALIKPLESQKEYNTVVRGQRYTVTENSYTIFPSVTGTIEISALFFSATDNNNQLLELESSPLLLNVVPHPNEANLNTWLPAQSLYIEDNLAESTTLEAGQNLNRIISVEATGIPASALPPLSPLFATDTEIELLNVVLEEQMTEQGIISQRIEELSLTPKAAGTFTLPAVTLPWWNTLADKAQTAAISERTISVIGSPAAQTQPLPPLKNPATISAATSSSGNSSITLLIWLLTAITLLTTLGFIYSFNRLRKLQNKPAPIPPVLTAAQVAPPEPSPSAIAAEQNAYLAFSVACRQNNPELTQLRLIEWAQAHWGKQSLYSLDAICEQLGNHTLSFLIIDLQQHLYGQENDNWRGDLLMESVDALRRRQQRNSQTSGFNTDFSYSASSIK